MAEIYAMYECANPNCISKGDGGTGVCLDVRTPAAFTPKTADDYIRVMCPVCAYTMRYRGYEHADADGYQPSKRGRVVWEYDYASYCPAMDGDLDVWLKARGEACWELAAIASNNLYVFKRPK